MSIKDWVERINLDTSTTDVRRIISFGIIKGFLRRVQVYPVWLDHPSFKAADKARTNVIDNELLNRGRVSHSRLVASEVSGSSSRLSPRTPHAALFNGAQDRERDETPRPAGAALAGRQNSLLEKLNRKDCPSGLPGLLDGEHSIDEVCTWVWHVALAKTFLQLSVRFRVSYRQLLVHLQTIGGAGEMPREQLGHLRRQDIYSPYITTEHIRESSNVDLGRVKLIHI